MNNNDIKITGYTSICSYQAVLPLDLLDCFPSIKLPYTHVRRPMYRFMPDPFPLLELFGPSTKKISSNSVYPLGPEMRSLFIPEHYPIGVL